jgi:hypothetical protein
LKDPRFQAIQTEFNARIDKTAKEKYSIKTESEGLFTIKNPEDLERLRNAITPPPAAPDPLKKPKGYAFLVAAFIVLFLSVFVVVNPYGNYSSKDMERGFAAMLSALTGIAGFSIK